MSLLVGRLMLQKQADHPTSSVRLSPNLGQVPLWPPHWQPEREPLLRPGAPSSVLIPTSKALVSSSEALVTSSFLLLLGR